MECTMDYYTATEKNEFELYVFIQKDVITQLIQRNINTPNKKSKL